VESLPIALLAMGCAAAIVLWLYGVYCYVQMVRHRAPGVSPFQIAWPPEHLTERGRQFRRRALRTYASFALLALVLLFLTTIFR
jgi:hypothetical protein